MKYRLRFVLCVLALIAMVGLPMARANVPIGAALDGDLLRGRVNVVFEPGAAPASIDLPGVTTVRAIEALDVVTVDAPAGIARTALEALPGVAVVEEDVRLFSLVTPDDSRYGEQYGPQQMGFPSAWDAVGFGNADVVVAVRVQILLAVGIRLEIGRRVAARVGLGPAVRLLVDLQAEVVEPPALPKERHFVLMLRAY